MTQIFHPLLALIASATNNELAKYVEYLKKENKILRARIPGQIHTKPEERERLLKYGKAVGRVIEELITIVSPATFYRWVREGKNDKPKTTNPKGGQRKPKEIRELVIEIAKTTGFGYTRIIGELRKLGIRKISRQTIRNIIKEEGIQPGPDRANDNWDNFIKRHAETLWAVDFFSVKTVTTRGLRTNALPKASPNLNGRCERFIETIKLECLAKFIIFGKRHLDYLVAEFVEYCNTRRSHMERDHLPPVREKPDEVATLKMDQIVVKSYVGGLVKSFERRAA